MKIMRAPFSLTMASTIRPAGTYSWAHSHELAKSKHPAAEFIQQLGVALFLARGSGACTTATIRPRETISSKTISAALRS